MKPLEAAKWAKHEALVARKSLTRDGRLRARWARRGVSLAPSAWIAPDADVQAGAEVGPNAVINSGSRVDGLARVGADVAIAFGAYLCCDTHELGPSSRRSGANVKLQVVIGDGCWIGANATILPGVTVAPGCVVAAGAVVTKDTTPDGLYAGVPARRVKDLPVG